MKSLIIYIVIFFIPYTLFSQNENPTEDLTGVYHLLDSERGIGNKQTFTKLFQYAKWGPDYVMAIAACEKCMPGIYKYHKEYSEDLKTAVFFNDAGLFLIAFDKESFVMMLPSRKVDADWTDFSFSNFYSKSKGKVASMNKQKIKDFILKLAE